MEMEFLLATLPFGFIWNKYIMLTKVAFIWSKIQQKVILWNIITF